MDAHDIWDAILLWLDHCKSPEILNYPDRWIETEMNEEGREDLLYIKENGFAG
ncbi:MAG: hypothetical protein JWM59_165 [Verrucomicrobiales bacterium]|nr:hypothetical protein [Verrucomicrobiales bacterium]